MAGGDVRLWWGYLGYFFYFLEIFRVLKVD
jgi:hypothetical protein